MSEIKKLRTRLSNVNKNATQYSMTIIEARDLLSEIDLILNKQVPAVIATVAEVPISNYTIMDGGTLT